MTVTKYRGLGGHEIVINNLCRGLGQIGYDTYIGAFSFEEKPPNYAGQVHLSRIKDFAKNLPGMKFDVIHNHHTLLNYYALVSSRPFIFHYHGTGNRIQEINLKISMSLCRNRISRILTVSETAQKQLKSIADVHADVIYNGVDLELFVENQPRPYVRGSPQLLFVGMLYPSKNVETLILGMERLRESYPNAHLQIVGEGEDLSRLKSIVSRKNLQNNVDFVGRMPHQDLVFRYASSDIYVSGSSLETFALPVFEAMACRKPVVLSDIPLHREVVAKSNAGSIFASVSDFAVKVSEVYQKNNELGIAARKFAEKYGWSNACSKLASIYEGIMTG